MEMALDCFLWRKKLKGNIMDRRLFIKNCGIAIMSFFSPEVKAPIAKALPVIESEPDILSGTITFEEDVPNELLEYIFGTSLPLNSMVVVFVAGLQADVGETVLFHFADGVDANYKIISRGKIGSNYKYRAIKYDMEMFSAD